MSAERWKQPTAPQNHKLQPAARLHIITYKSVQSSRTPQVALSTTHSTGAPAESLGQNRRAVSEAKSGNSNVCEDLLKETKSTGWGVQGTSNSQAQDHYTCTQAVLSLSAATPEVVTGSKFPAAKKALSDTAGCHPHSAASCSCRKTVPFPMFAWFSHPHLLAGYNICSELSYLHSVDAII